MHRMIFKDVRGTTRNTKGNNFEEVHRVNFEHFVMINAFSNLICVLNGKCPGMN